jgi:hypothetical protein
MSDKTAAAKLDADLEKSAAELVDKAFAEVEEISKAKTCSFTNK